MKTLLTPLLASSFLILVSGTAVAQTAPIRLGQTTTMKQVEETDTRLARLSTRITELEAVIGDLTGRMENLEYRLAQEERERKELEKLNADLTSRLSALESKIDSLSVSVKPHKTIVDTDVTDDLNLDDPSFGKFDTGPTDLRGDSIRKKTTIIVPDDADKSYGLGTIRIEQLPNDAGALIALGKARVLNRDYIGAVSAFKAFETSFEDDPRIGENRYWLGEALYNTGDYTGSADYFTKVLRLHKDLPSYNDSYHKLARSLRMLDQKAKACQILAVLDGNTDIDTSTRQRIINEKKESGCQ